MHNVKVLWGAILALTVGIIVLLSLYLTEMGGAKQPGADRSPGAESSQHVVAKIGGREFTQGELAEELTKHYGAEMLNRMLDREALRLEAKELGVEISAAEMDRELKQMQQGYDNEEAYFASMQEQLGLSKEEIKEDLHYKLLHERLAIRKIVVSDKEVDQYIQANPELFKQADEWHLHKIILSTLDQAKKAIKAYNSGEDFAILARDRSIDESGSQGGDLGWVEEGDPFQPAPIMEAARKLEVGQVSGPIKTEGGYAVILLSEKREKKDQEKPVIRESVRKMLALQEGPSLNEYLINIRTKWQAVIVESTLKP
ncbi:peptidylprolyl isomerase [Paenibacillus lutrae]|uniref:peptidylprolyl isomerase n=1 Tax=Paenibacillus lutrae TaxID=2078573 RepID=A0A7X3FM23_9BACL|nr:peptidyl-prolyl cis-trans isomerase [Paenibacillus lutrae]MVP02206.1 peptidylprolyl isomerase [Paenibacillus lutrae]